MSRKDMRVNTILRPLQEIVGTVDGIETFRGNVIVSILMNRRVILEIPSTKMKEWNVKPEQLNGQRISILRTFNDYILKKASKNEGSASTVLQRHT